MTTFTVTIPTIETERLILRAPLENDIDALESFYATERSHLVGGPLDRPNCWRLISGNFGHWLMRGYGMWHLHHKAECKSTHQRKMYGLRMKTYSYTSSFDV